MAMEREDLALVAELSAELAAGGTKLVQPWVRDRAFEVTRESKYGLRGVRVGEASHQVHSPPESTVTMSRSSQADSVRGVTVTVLNLCQSQAHHQVQRMIPRLLHSMCSQARTRMVSFLSFPRGGVDVVEETGSRQRLCFQFRPIDLLYLMPRSPGTTGWSMSQSPTL